MIVENNDELNVELDKVKAALENIEKNLYELRYAMQKHELKSPPAMLLLRAYELQRDIFFAIMDFGMHEKIPKKEMAEI